MLSGAAFEWACSGFCFLPLLEVFVVSWFKRIGFRPYLRVADYRCVGHLDKAIDFLRACLSLALCSKYPSAFPVVLPILLFYPLQRLVMVSSYGPSPQLEEDYVVELGEHLLRGHISVIVRQTAYLGVEFENYIRLLGCALF